MARSKIPKWAIGVMSGLVMLAVSLFAYGAYQYYSLFPRIYQPLDEAQPSKGNPSILGIDHETDPTEIQNKDKEMKPFTLLILGVDSRGEKNSRSDTIILSVVNPVSKKVTLLSIPRDTRVFVPDHGYEKMNHTMFFGGVPMVKSALENFLDVSIDRYITIDFEGFRRVVDELGGIQVEVKKRMKYYDPADGTDIDLKPGVQTLDGEEALDYARYRKSDIGPDDSDFERIERQQEVIRAIADKASSIASIFKIFAFMDIVGDHIKTDLTREEIESLMASFQGFSSEGIESITLGGVDRYLPYGDTNLYFYVVSDEERNRVKELLNTALQEEEEMEQLKEAAGINDIGSSN